MEPPHDPRIPRYKEAKLLVNAQRTTKATSKKRPGRLLLEGEDNQDITIKSLQSQLAEMAQILVANRLMKPTQTIEGGPSKERSKRSKLLK